MPSASTNQQAAGAIRVGIGGWTFEPWRGVFYPEGLPQKRELEYASQHLTSIEINGTYYGSQKPESFARWRDETPEGFVFSLKGTRFTTNRRVLAEAGSSIERFFASGVMELKEKLGPINWQFLPSKQFDPDEVKRKISLNLAVAYADHRGHRLNLVDTPGYGDFIYEARAGLRVVEAAVVVVDAVAGVQVQTERVWKFANELDLPRAVVINRLDRERGDFFRTLESLQKRLKGRLVFISTLSGSRAAIDLRHVMGKRLRLVGSLLRPRTLEEKMEIKERFMDRFWPAFESHAIQPVIDSVYVVAQANEAHQRMAENRNIGKIVLQIR